MKTTSVAETKKTLIHYLLHRFSAWSQDENIPSGVLQAVRALGVTNALDINRRVQAVHQFNQLEAATALASANKRVANIPKKNDGDKVTANGSTSLTQLS